MHFSLALPLFSSSPLICVAVESFFNCSLAFESSPDVVLSPLLVTPQGVFSVELVSTTTAIGAFQLSVVTQEGKGGASNTYGLADIACVRSI